MVENHNPYAAPAVDVAGVDLPEHAVSARRYRWSQALAIVCVAGSPIASALAVWEVESIIGSGAVLALLSVILICLGWAPMLRPLLLISAAGLLVVIGCFLVINLNSWSPNQAQVPIGQATIGLATLMQSGWFLIRHVARIWAKSQQDHGQSADVDGASQVTSH